MQKKQATEKKPTQTLFRGKRDRRRPQHTHLVGARGKAAGGDANNSGRARATMDFCERAPTVNY